MMRQGDGVKCFRSLDGFFPERSRFVCFRKPATCTCFRSYDTTRYFAFVLIIFCSIRSSAGGNDTARFCDTAFEVCYFGYVHTALGLF